MRLVLMRPAENAVSRPYISLIKRRALEALSRRLTGEL
jgi:hypothetical protein